MGGGRGRGLRGCRPEPGGRGEQLTCRRLRPPEHATNPSSESHLRDVTPRPIFEGFGLIQGCLRVDRRTFMENDVKRENPADRLNEARSSAGGLVSSSISAQHADRFLGRF